jgi:hypothetical protein
MIIEYLRTEECVKSIGLSRQFNRYLLSGDSCQGGGSQCVKKFPVKIVESLNAFDIQNDLLGPIA